MRRAVLVLAGAVALAAAGNITAQVRPVYDTGAAGLVQLLERLQTTASVLHTGAHPDDEDSAFLARAARGDHARTAYLSLNRGEGGQNIIGPELFDALGVIRTEELLQARRLDGAEQFFTRTFDYGFSKTNAEAASKWNEREVLGDMVRVIRTFRPLVIYSRFSGTPADGHGQHQFAGYLTPLAFVAAADSMAFPEQLVQGLRPWRALKLYRGGGRAETGAGAILTVPTGIVDPVTGRSYAQVAAEGRSQHKSQQMGTVEPFGPSSTSLRLVTSLVPARPDERSVFDGIDVTVPGIGRLADLPAGMLDADLRAIDSAAATALREYRPLEPAGIVAPLAAGLTATRRARASLNDLTVAAAARADADFLLAAKERDFVGALVRAAGVSVDPLSDEETIAPGGTLHVDMRTFIERATTASITSTTLHVPATWTTTRGDPSRQGGGAFARETPTQTDRYTLTVPTDAEPTQPYYLTQPRTGDQYRWPATGPVTVPFAEPLLVADVTLQIAGVPVTVSRPVQYRVGDRIRGELRRDVNVVPAISVGLESPLLIVPTSLKPSAHRLVVRATSGSPQPLAGTVRLRLPSGWTAAPTSAPVTFNAKGEEATIPFVVTAPASRVSGSAAITAVVSVGDVSYSRDQQTIAYPHIQTHRLYWPATTTVRVVDLRVAPVHVGYIMGSGDEVPDALRRMGIDVTMIDANLLSGGDLSRFDTIVAGIRASETRPDFVANQRRLREYMERGGTLVVQYQQGDYAARNLAPYPVTAAGNPRVTDETAPVAILAPNHPIFTFPNRITAADFDGWVQERDLYAFSTFDSRYLPLVESADPGEAPQRGGELYAEVGKGRYVYTAYAWFRQLPAGVPGAYRLFANLVSLGKAARSGSPRSSNTAR
jgi:LmbE family N-acetylglucosaminyl deacetylase